MSARPRYDEADRVRSDVVDTEPGGAIARLMQELGKLPGIGPKTAERLTHHLLGADRDDVLALADALRAIKESIRPLPAVLQPDRRASCAPSAPTRAATPSVICVVEQPRDLAALERAGTLSRPLPRPARPAGAAGQRRAGAADRRRACCGACGRAACRRSSWRPTRPWKAMARRCTSPACWPGPGVRVTRLARGLPSGSVLEFANNQMLADALEGRRTF